MHIAISGASGLIGSALRERLVTRGNTVTRLVRYPTSVPGETAWDPARGAMDLTALAGVDAVVNLNGVSIAERRWTAAQKAAMLESRVTSTRLLAAHVKGAGVRRFISASAVGYYGDRGDEMLTEDSTPGADFLASLCREWEASTQQAVDDGVPTHIVRIGVVLTMRGGLLKQMAVPFRLGLGGRVGSGRQWLSWISLDDLLGVFERALAGGLEPGPVNAVAPNPVTNLELTHALGQELHRPTLLPTPMFALHARFGRELVDSLMLVSQRAVPARLQAIGHEFAHPDIRAALRALVRG
jgi:uncharacterized protein (TIGR01777 family)